MFDKINISNIIKDHLNTLKDFKEVKKKGGDFKSAPYYKEDLLIFFILPLLTVVSKFFSFAYAMQQRGKANVIK